MDFHQFVVNQTEIMQIPPYPNESGQIQSKIEIAKNKHMAISLDASSVIFFEFAEHIVQCFSPIIAVLMRVLK